MHLKAVIFDLDGVITDTAELHYRGWQRVAGEEGLVFDRALNERLRGVARRASIEIILAANQRTVSEATLEAMMERKNRYYVDLLDAVTPADLLPGALPLIEALRQAGIKVALGSASKNAQQVLARLGIARLIDVVADGHSVEHVKPAPDLFLYAAARLGVAPAACAVVEDAAAGIDAALAAGMWAVGLGPQTRVGHAHLRFDSLAGVTLAALQTGLEAAAWSIVEPLFSADGQQHKETLFTIGNGAFCVRGSLEEGYPDDAPACFAHGVWDDMPVNFTELANLPRWIGVDLWVNGERFRLDCGRIVDYRRWLDLRTGVLARSVLWQPTANGPTVQVQFERVVNLADEHTAAVRVQITAVDGAVDVRLRTGITLHVENTGLLHWLPVAQAQSAQAVALAVRTRATRHTVGVAAALREAGPVASAVASEADGQPAVERRVLLQPGQHYTLDKFVALATSLDDDEPLATAQHRASVAAAGGYAAVRAANDAAWSALWHDMDVVIEGDREAQLALRFNIFQLVVAAPRFTEHASIGAKSLSGFGYRHHVFWDTEIFILPMFAYSQPALARNMLMYRYHNLPGARAKALRNGYAGAQFPWESAADGGEVTPTWVPHFADPTQLIRIWTGDIEIHITADIAYAVMQFWQISGDDDWLRDYGAEIVLDGASFWASAAVLEDDGRYHYRNVIGPDEYHDRIDDNAYTNTLAQWHLATALRLLGWLDAHAPHQRAALSARLELTPSRLAHWQDVIDRMYLAVDPHTGLIEQFAGYHALAEPDFATLRDPERARSMQAILGIEGCAATQILKQPDVLQLQYLLPQQYAAEQVRANYAYYDPRTDHEHGSSLGPSISAIMACRVGDPAAAYDHFMRAARADLVDVRHNANDGIHAASAGGLWQAAIFGFGGLLVTGAGWATQPQLPRHWTRLAFKFFYCGVQQSVEITAHAANPA